ADQKGVDAQDLAQLAGIDQAQKDPVLASLRALVPDLDRLDGEATADQAAGARLWTTSVRNSVLKTQVLTDDLADRLEQKARQIRQDNDAFAVWSQPGLVLFAALTVLASLAVAAWRARSTAQR